MTIKMPKMILDTVLVIVKGSSLGITCNQVIVWASAPISPVTLIIVFVRELKLCGNK